MAVSFLHSYINPAHEREAQAVIAERWPDLFVCASWETWPQQREYERTLVCVMNAYVGATMRSYYRRLEEGLRAVGVGCPILITQSNGGTVSIDEAARIPVRTMFSGPASGVMAAAKSVRQSGEAKLFTLDMGGTSADMSLIDGRPRVSVESTIGDFPLFLPAVAIETIGAGGGSIAWVDAHGVLKVGPRSAGADPGPACYGRGGREPTVTDAYLITGILGENDLLGGRMELSRARAEDAIGSLAKVLGVETVQAAEAVLRVATANMVASFLPMIARYGVDHREFSLQAYGGAGPTHAFLLAAEAGIRKLVIPHSPGAMCAVGAAVSDVQMDFVRSVLTELSDEGGMEEMYTEMEETARMWLTDQGLETAAAAFERSADMRYKGQSFEIMVGLAGEGDYEEAFHRRYEETFGYRDPDSAIEVLQIRMLAKAPNPVMGASSSRLGESDGLAPVETREVTPSGEPARRSRLPQGPYTRRFEAHRARRTSSVRYDRFRHARFRLPGRRVGQPSRGGDRMSESKAPRTKPDPVLLEILRCQFQGVVEEMGELLTRCGHTVFVKETQDFIVALVTPRGEVAACSVDIGLWIGVGQNFGAVFDAGGPYRPGDVWFTNDPEQSRGLVTHLLDVFCWAPHLPQRMTLVCFAVAFIHCTDVGGLAPGSTAPSAVDQHQEGVVIPVTRLVAEDEMREDVLRIFLRNCRIPEKNRGDVLAMLGALKRAELRVTGLAAKFGGGVLRTALDDILDYAEAQARSLIRDVPDGDYEFWDYLEGDLMPEGRHVRIRLTLRIRGEDMLLDFAGTDPQVAAAFNIPSYSMDGHYLLVMGVINFMRSVHPDIVYNSGLVRAVRVNAPRGTLLNPEPGAPCGARQATFFKVSDIVLGALARAWRERMPAAGCGQGSIMLVSAPDFTTGTNLVSTVQPLVGGSGARPFDDGTEGVDFTTGFYRNIPTEVLETEIPVLVERYGLKPDSGGAGRLRGGCGLDYSLRILVPGGGGDGAGAGAVSFSALGKGSRTSGRGRTRVPSSPRRGPAPD